MKKAEEKKAEEKKAEEKKAEIGIFDFLDCGHHPNDLNADMKCSICGCDANVPF